MIRSSIKIVGASGQGINSIGAIVAKGLKRSGYFVFGYREYPSLIKGGHASYQLDISGEQIRSSETTVNILVALNHHGLEVNLEDLKQGGVVLHVTPDWRYSEYHQDLIKNRKLRVIYLPAETILRKLGADNVLLNVLVTASLWSMLGLKVEELRSLVDEKFVGKPELAALNVKCIEEGVLFSQELDAALIELSSPDIKVKDDLLLTGSQAMGLGALHAGVRLFSGYPMTPASPLLGFIVDLENETHTVVKQAEDEITAAQIVSGAMFAGTRALTATSGGGFDLMSETLSLNAMIENPTVFVLAQRPGPSTGLPTWTSQDCLLQAVHGAHGEFAHCVLAVSNSQDAFDLMSVAFNLAERYQISVIVLTEKQTAEALYTQAPYDLEKADMDRGRLITDAMGLATLVSYDRYCPEADGGISPRWLPGSLASTYCAQSDEHDSAGTVDESAENRRRQTVKRMGKLDLLKGHLSEPDLTMTMGSQQVGDEIDDVSHELELLLVSWGSSGDVIRDVLCSDALSQRKIASLHYTYLWPLRTDRLVQLARLAAQVVLVEQSYRGQLGMLIRAECGLNITEKILKFDGRPFFYDEFLALLSKKLESQKQQRTTAP
ncbi:2-oxoacid:acceptor oxidoreductase subunit alpha [Bradyrhizobium pachyrhizi]|uniref:2-oxoacid:acceptor oxidoreductase subunit alpha n=1 Tax=Bradyrhizobium pachyrhizi TaxID=280333 RepID=A0A844SN85_9BRAD|nr:2-oxoacid:acceptor oxidoreductase subunit alpha [Bradyrhizobium pachyrhizi]MVT64872.1 2-oxoacid:acceptor oxidoreductase subunit alpha [Bradyrhizobium pachyrhizi]